MIIWRPQIFEHSAFEVLCTILKIEKKYILRLTGLKLKQLFESIEFSKFKNTIQINERVEFKKKEVAFGGM